MFSNEIYGCGGVSVDLFHIIHLDLEIDTTGFESLCFLRG